MGADAVVVNLLLVNQVAMLPGVLREVRLVHLSQDFPGLALAGAVLHIERRSVGLGDALVLPLQHNRAGAAFRIELHVPVALVGDLNFAGQFFHGRDFEFLPSVQTETDDIDVGGIVAVACVGEGIGIPGALERHLAHIPGLGSLGGQVASIFEDIPRAGGLGQGGLATIGLPGERHVLLPHVGRGHQIRSMPAVGNNHIEARRIETVSSAN